MVKEQTLSFIQSADGLHICFTQGEVKYIQVLFHPLFVSGFWNDHNIALQEEAEGNLCGTFTVFPADSFSTGLVKKSFLPSANGPQDSCCTPYFTIYSCAAFLLLENMCFHLIDCRLYLYKAA